MKWCFVCFRLCKDLFTKIGNDNDQDVKYSVEVRKTSLFVFLRDDPQQNGVKLLTPVSNLVFNALSDGTIHFALYGSSLNHNLIGWNNSNSQSESFVLVVLKAAMERKKKGTIWKSNENWVRNWCQKWHTILLRVVSWKNKQCSTKYWRVEIQASHL